MTGDAAAPGQNTFRRRDFPAAASKGCGPPRPAGLRASCR